MKLVINYDLLKKIFEAKHGIDLKFLDIWFGIDTAVIITLIPLNSSFQKGDMKETIATLIITTANGFSTLIAFQAAASNLNKKFAQMDLNYLTRELNHYCIETDGELIKKAKKYKTEYSLDTESFPPKVMQKKYIMVPVHNDWGNNERSLVQEHIIGTNEYALSYGKPEEKKKVYSLKPARKFNKN